MNRSSASKDGEWSLPAYRVTFTSSNSNQQETVEDVARAAIASLGSYDHGLQDYMQMRLNRALGGAR